MNRAGLYEVLDAYLAALGRRDPSSLRWADAALTSENNVMLEVGDGLWGTIESFGPYRLRFADPATGQVGYFGTVHEHVRGIRLHRAPQAERRRRTSRKPKRSSFASRIPGIKFENPRYWDKPILNADARSPVPRAEMIRLANGYFDTLQLNDGTIHTRFHPDCNRVENGVQTTHNPAFAKIVPVAALGCEEQFRMGNYRYDDRLRARRFPLVDEERGLVLAFGFIDHAGRLAEYQLTDGRTVQSPVRRPHSFYLAELFKIDSGLICQIEANFITVPYHMPSPWDGR